VISDLRPSWVLLKLYGVRFWMEPGFRSDKKLVALGRQPGAEVGASSPAVLGMAWAAS